MASLHLLVKELILRFTFIKFAEFYSKTSNPVPHNMIAIFFGLGVFVAQEFGFPYKTLGSSPLTPTCAMVDYLLLLLLYMVL